MRNAELKLPNAKNNEQEKAVIKLLTTNLETRITKYEIEFHLKLSESCWRILNRAVEKKCTTNSFSSLHIKWLHTYGRKCPHHVQ